MTYPAKPDPAYDYTNSVSGGSVGAQAGPQLASDFAKHKASIDALITFIQTAIRSDGVLNNGAVTPQSFSAAAAALVGGWNPKGGWLTATSYAVKDIVEQPSGSGINYVCVTAHTSGVFATDLAAGKWQSLTGVALAGNNAFTGANDFTGGSITVPTPNAGDNSSKGASTQYVDRAMASATNAVVIRAYLAGLGISNNVTTKIDVAAGVCADDTNVVMLSLPAGTIDCGVVGANGLDAGSLAINAWYHAFVIGKADGTRARLASTSLTPTLPTGYIYKRRIGSFKTNGSAQIIAFTQNGDLFQWSTTVQDFNNQPLGSIGAVSTSPVTVPTGVRVTWLARCWGSTSATNSGWGIAIYTPGLTVAGTADVGLAGYSGSSGNGQDGCPIAVLTDTSAQISFKPSSGVATFINAATYGWIDRRGRDD